MKLASIALLLAPSLAAAGTIKGKVSFEGTPPPSTHTSYGADAACTSGDHPSSDVVVDAGGGLAETVVYLRKVKAKAAPEEPVVVVQDGCEYTPRVVVVQDGQPLEIHNGDPTFHNVRGNKGGKVAFNLAQNKGAKPIVRDDLGDPGEVVSLACDVHPWMKGWVMVLDHPYFAVTGADGSFVIDGVAPGRYELVAWHPTLGSLEKKVRVKKKKKAARAGFVFKAKP